MCVWEKGNIIQKTTQPYIFFEEIQDRTIRFITRDNFRKLQKDETRLMKSEVATLRFILVSPRIEPFHY